MQIETLEQAKRIERKLAEIEEFENECAGNEAAFIRLLYSADANANVPEFLIKEVETAILETIKAHKTFLERAFRGL